VSRTPTRTLYFTAVPLFPTTNGGALGCRNHVRRLAEDPQIDLVVCVTGPDEEGHANRQAVVPFGAEFVFLPFQEAADRRLPFSRRIGRRWPFLFEASAVAQPQVDTLFMELVRTVEPQVVVVDYLPSASFVPSVYSAAVRRVTITLNREVDYYRELRRLGTLPPDASDSWLAARRLWLFERKVYRRSDAVVALAAADLPAWRGRPRVRVAIPPVFDPQPSRWHPTGSRTILFVGNVAHDPNRQAIEWLCTDLAPELAQRSVGVRVIGASEAGAPSEWRQPNVEFLGAGDEEVVRSELASAGLFVAPISNAFGSKIKLLDCLAHATPFVATEEALSGLPFLTGVPRIDLARPEEAATLIGDLLVSPERLVALSRHFEVERDEFSSQQTGVWGQLLTRIA
jgi:glycosyltransferase involved in cell wall biosynthesis